MNFDDETGDRVAFIQIRVSDEEKLLIKEGAKKAKRSVSNWLRWLATNAAKDVA